MPHMLEIDEPFLPIAQCRIQARRSVILILRPSQRVRISMKD